MDIAASAGMSVSQLIGSHRDRRGVRADRLRGGPRSSTRRDRRCLGRVSRRPRHASSRWHAPATLTERSLLGDINRMIDEVRRSRRTAASPPNRRRRSLGVVKLRGADPQPAHAGIAASPRASAACVWRAHVRACRGVDAMRNEPLCPARRADRAERGGAMPPRPPDWCT
jgi:hypothetical protein